MISRRRTTLLACLLAAAILLNPRATAVALPLVRSGITHIFFSAGCVDCWPFVEQVLLPTLQDSGLAAEYEIHDYTRPDERRYLLQIADSVELPRSIADSLYAFVPTARGDLAVASGVTPPVDTKKPSLQSDGSRFAEKAMYSGRSVRAATMPGGGGAGIGR